MIRRCIQAAALAAALVSGLAAPSHAQLTGHYVSTGGDRIFYRMAGSGPVMLLIHGFPLSGALFEGQLAGLSKTFTVIAPDLPGFGNSITGTPYQSERHYAADLFALLDSLGVGTAIIGGHSMGGQVTLEMYREQPNRFTGMILFDTNPAPASIVEQAQWPAYGLQAEKLGAAAIAPAVVGVMVTGTSLARKPELGTRLTKIVAAAMPDGVLGGGIALATRPNYQPLLALIGVPTLVVVGVDDPVYPLPISQKLAAGIRGAVLAALPGAAHASMFQRPDDANQAVLNWATGSGLSTR